MDAGAAGAFEAEEAVAAAAVVGADEAVGTAAADCVETRAGVGVGFEERETVDESEAVEEVTEGPFFDSVL